MPRTRRSLGRLFRYSAFSVTGTSLALALAFAFAFAFAFASDYEKAYGRAPWRPDAKKLADMTGEDTVNQNEPLVHILESYRDSTSVVSHVTVVFPQFAESFLECADITGYVGFGDPNEEAKTILDGFGSTYMRPFESLTRN